MIQHINKTQFSTAYEFMYLSIYRDYLYVYLSSGFKPKQSGYVWFDNSNNEMI